MAVSIGGYDDLFATGLGFDLAGAILLARGLLMASHRYARRFQKSRNTFGWLNVRFAEDHAAGKAGVIVLCTGFSIQALGYLLQIGGVESEASGARASVVAAACAGLAIVLGLAFGEATHEPWTKGFLLELAHHEEHSGERNDLPSGGELLSYAYIMGLVPADYVPDLAEHARTIWGVQEIRRHLETGQPL